VTILFDDFSQAEHKATSLHRFPPLTSPVDFLPQVDGPDREKFQVE